MVRYSADHKQKTRERIVEKAAETFVADGFQATTIKTLMKETGLTNGGFYAHFDSKDDLLAEVLKRRMERTREAIEKTFMSEDLVDAVGFVADGVERK